MEGYFSNRVRDVISHSREEAIRLGNDFIGTEHLLLGIIREHEGIAIKILRNLRISLPELKKTAEEAVEGPEGFLSSGQIPLTQMAEKILKVTYLEAKLYKSEVIGTEHLLLSLVRDDEDSTAQLLEAFGITYDAVREELDGIISGKPAPASRLDMPLRDLSVDEVSSLPLDTKGPKQDAGSLSLDIWIDPGNSSKEMITEFYDALSELHRALGGVGIVIRDDTSEVLALESEDS